MKNCFVNYYLSDGFFCSEKFTAESDDKIKGLENKGYYFWAEVMYKQDINTAALLTNKEITEEEFIRICKKEVIERL